MNSFEDQSNIYHSSLDNYHCGFLEDLEYFSERKRVEQPQKLEPSQANNIKQGQEKPQKKPRKGRKRSRKQQELINGKLMGRPCNQGIENQHLTENKSYNDVIYHYARLLIFLKLKKGKQSSAYNLHLHEQEKNLMTQTQQIMNLKVFPSFSQRKVTFLLHPNSLHFVFRYHQQRSQKTDYFSEELKYMFLSFLKKKGIFSSIIYEYITDYWEDIVYLANNPEGNIQQEIDPFDNQNVMEERDFQLNHGVSYNMGSGNPETENRNQQISVPTQSRKSKKNEMNELDHLKRQLREDDSIAAYQIASYLHACMQKFGFHILP